MNQIFKLDPIHKQKLPQSHLQRHSLHDPHTNIHLSDCRLTKLSYHFNTVPQVQSLYIHNHPTGHYSPNETVDVSPERSLPHNFN